MTTVIIVIATAVTFKVSFSKEPKYNEITEWCFENIYFPANDNHIYKKRIFAYKMSLWWRNCLLQSE